MSNVQTICDLNDQEEYYIDQVVLSASILQFLTKNNNVVILWQKKIETY